MNKSVYNLKCGDYLIHKETNTPVYINKITRKYIEIEIPAKYYSSGIYFKIDTELRFLGEIDYRKMFEDTYRINKNILHILFHLDELAKVLYL